MADRIELLEQKFSQLSKLLERLQAENNRLTQENQDLRRQLTGLRAEFESYRRDQKDRDDQVRDKLLTVMAQVRELEQLPL